MEIIIVLAVGVFLSWIVAGGLEHHEACRPENAGGERTACLKGTNDHT